MTLIAAWFLTLEQIKQQSGDREIVTTGDYSALKSNSVQTATETLHYAQRIGANETRKATRLASVAFLNGERLIHWKLGK
jgi:hypothetical protein